MHLTSCDTICKIKKNRGSGFFAVVEHLPGKVLGLRLIILKKDKPPWAIPF